MKTYAQNVAPRKIMYDEFNRFFKTSFLREFFKLQARLSVYRGSFRLKFCNEDFSLKLELGISSFFGNFVDMSNQLRLAAPILVSTRNSH